MAITLVQLAQAAIGVAGAIIYTVPANTKTIIKSIDVANTAAAVRLLSVFLVPNAGAPGVANVMFYALAIPAEGVLHWTGAQILDTAGDTIWVQADIVGMTITISGVEET